MIKNNKKKAANYVNNADFLKSIILYKKETRVAKKAKLPKPRIPDYVGKCLLLIAENLSHKSWFSQYSFRDEMISDGIENCILYFDNFDPKKSKNPFAYFTQIIYFAFRRRIIRERKQLYTKYKFAEHQGVLGDDGPQQSTDDTQLQAYDHYDNIVDFIKNFEDAEKLKKIKKKVKKKVKPESLFD